MNSNATPGATSPSSQARISRTAPPWRPISSIVSQKARPLRFLWEVGRAKTGLVAIRKRRVLRIRFGISFLADLVVLGRLGRLFWMGLFLSYGY